MILVLFDFICMLALVFSHNAGAARLGAVFVHVVGLRPRYW